MSVFQDRVRDWLYRCFPKDTCRDVTERGDRFLEEALELLQATGYDLDRVAALTDYVRNRPPGQAFQEVGGVEVTLAALCAELRVDKQAAGFAELTRICAPKVMDAIRRKQEAKRDIHGPLP